MRVRAPRARPLRPVLPARPRRWRAPGPLAALLAAALVVLTACGGDGVEGRSDSREPPSAQRFLDRFVAADGRVVRHDQGGDTVSEGQAYAMLVAASVGDRRRFARVWRWTRRHLQRPDGLLAWHWKDGRVVDRQPAADADLDAAHALVLAGRRFGRRAWRRAGRRIARSVLRRESTATTRGRLVLAGPWARRGRVVNPSYFAFSAFEAIGGRSMRRAARASHAALSSLLDAAALPPDWAALGDPRGAKLVVGTSPSGDPPRYAWDAVRIPLRLAASCRPELRKLAARMWGPLLGGDPGALPRALDGTPQGAPGAPGLAGAAAAARAAGDDAAARKLLRRADEAENRSPTYYGSALVALARTAWRPDC